MPSTITDRLNGLTTSVAVKAPCRVATTANITLSGLQSIDGVTVATGDRVLVKNQTSAVSNGIYVAATSAWTRAADFNGSLDLVGGTQLHVISGTVNGGTYWKVSGEDTSVVVGTDSIEFVDGGPSTAAGVSTSEGISVQSHLTIINRNLIRLSRYDTPEDAIDAALAASATEAITLLLDEDADWPSELEKTLTGKLNIETRGQRTMTCTSLTELDYMLKIDTAGHDLCFNGFPTLAGDGMSKKGLHVYSTTTGDERGELTIEGYRASDFRLQSSGDSASGLWIIGGFKRINLADIHIQNIGRDAGTGVAGSHGSHGIVVFYGQGDGANPREIIARNLTVHNIDTDDADGSAAAIDCDGILFFQHWEAGATINLDGFVTRNAKGRSVKIYSQNPPTVRNGAIFRDIPSITGGGTEIACQGGDGTVENIEIEYDGTTAHDQGGSVVSFSVGVSMYASQALGLAGSPLGAMFGVTGSPDTLFIHGPGGVAIPKLFGHGAVRKVQIRNLTGDTISTFAQLDYSRTDTNPRKYTFDGVTLNGGAFDYFISTNSLGAAANTRLAFGEIRCAIDSAWCKANGNPSKLRARFENVVNDSGSDVPLIVRINGAGVDQSTLLALDWGHWFDRGGSSGFQRYTGMNSSSTGFLRGLHGGVGGVSGQPQEPSLGLSSVAGGTIHYGTIALAAGATWTSTPFGFRGSAGGDGLLRLSSSAGAPGMYQVEAASTTVTVVLASAIVSASSTGSTAGTASKLNLWKDSTTQCFKITNDTAGEVRITPEIVV